MPRLFLVLGVLLAMAGVAQAQSPDDTSIVEFDPGYAVRPTSAVEGPGIKIGEGTVLRPVFGMETGVVSNVFYEEAEENPAGVLRLLFQIGTASLSTDRLSPASAEGNDDTGVQDLGDFQYRANVRLAYDFLLSNNDTVTDTGGLGAGATFKGMVRPNGPWSFGFDENFNRLIRATNFETSENTNRDVNYLRLMLLYRPSGRSISGFLYYNNTIDIFESDSQKFADRWENRFGIHPMWRWLPQTMIYADVSIGIVDGFGEGDAASAGTPDKVTSYPLAANVGLSTLLNINTTLNVQAGYTNGFYASGPNFSAPMFNARVGYRYAPKGRVTLGYEYVHQDSINANFFRDHTARLHIAHGAGPLVFMAQPELRFRTYRGVQLVSSPDGDTRNDVIFQIVTGVHYNFRKWIAATLDYRFTLVESDFEYMSGSVLDDPSYQRHDALLGVRVAM